MTTIPDYKTNTFERNKRLTELAAELRDLMQLERQDVSSGISYEHAVDTCTGCPVITGVGVCCKDNGWWEAAHESDFKYLEQCDAVIRVVTNWLKPDPLTSDE